MLYLFYQHPLYWLYPALTTLFLLIVGARFFRRFYKGEAEILLNPGIIFCSASLWFIFIPSGIMGLIVFGAANIIRLLIGGNK